VSQVPIPAPDFAGAKRTYCSSKQAATDLSYVAEDITISGKRLAKLPPVHTLSQRSEVPRSFCLYSAMNYAIEIKALTGRRHGA
jgi:hypothetical protein